MSASSFGYTSEYQDSYSKLIYLRSRMYNPVIGRFLTRDIWSGDANRPSSYNSWLYSYGNPIIWSDPTGMSPECNIIAGGAGNSYLQCEKIIRGLDPASNLSLHFLEINDALDSDCPLYEIMELPGSNAGKDTQDMVMSRDYGFWFHYLLEKTPGWWNGGGTRHVNFSDVAALSISSEVGKGVTRASRYPDIVVEAFARKGRQIGFYEEVGGRQIVRAAVNATIFLNGGFFRIIANRDKSDRTGKVSFSDALNTFSKRLDDFSINLPSGSDLATRMQQALQNSDNKVYNPDKPWDWGNPLVGFRDNPSLDRLEAALSGKAGPFGKCPFGYRHQSCSLS
jgi:RHS repeat-associated protein